MLASSATITTRAGSQQFGPKCAQAMGLIQPRPKTVASIAEQDASGQQVDWLQYLAGAQHAENPA